MVGVKARRVGWNSGVARWLVLVLAAWVAGCGGRAGPGDAAGSADANADDPSLGRYAGVWRGPADAVAYVRSVTIEKNEFPCYGQVEVQYTTREVYKFDGTWEMRDNDKLAGKFGIGAGPKNLEATVWIDNQLLTGQVKSPPNLMNGKEFTFSQYRRVRKQ